MTAITFDTLMFVQKLKKAGVVEAEAEAIAEAVRDVQASADLATKADVALLQQSTRQDVAMLQKELAITKSELEVKIAETKADLIRWVVGVGMLQTALIAAMLLKIVPF